MPEHASAQNLRLRLCWLGRLRWFGAAGLAGLALFVHFALELALAWRALLVLAAIIAAYNLLFHFLLLLLERKRRDTITFKQLELLANLQIGLDLVFLTLALHYSGGVENPFIMVYLLHPIIAGILLTPQSAYLQAGWATLLFVAMAVCEATWPALHRPVGNYLPVGFFRAPLVIAGETAAVAVSLYACVYLASSITRRLHGQDRRLREAHKALERRSAELMRTINELQELEERKSRFLGLAVHQLRGPLAATEGCLAAACDGYTDDPAKQAEFIRRARVRIQGMLQTVRDLLTLARTHELTEPSRQTRMALDDVASRVVDQYADLAASRQIDLVFCPGTQGVEVIGDERALADAIGNLVSNAVKYTKEGGHVKVASRVSHGEIICEVIDDGIGIPEAEKENLFQDFFRAANARASGQEGTGLGLSIVKEIITKYGGRVVIESLESLGTCVAFYLPLGPQSAMAPPSRESRS